MTDEHENKNEIGQDIPELEDASLPESHGEVIDDDEHEVELDEAARSLDGDESATVENEEDLKVKSPQSDPDDDLSDVAHISDVPAPKADVRKPQRIGDWEFEPSAHKVVVELKRVENEVRALLEQGDSRRKRKLSGTQRWCELEEDIISWRYSGRFDEDSLRRLQELVARRHFLFRHLRFLSDTRPVMNS